jgi:hypothetical protein
MIGIFRSSDWAIKNLSTRKSKPGGGFLSLEIEQERCRIQLPCTGFNGKFPGNDHRETSRYAKYRSGDRMTLQVSVQESCETRGSLERANIVRQTSAAKRNKLYCAQSLLDILEDPAQLTAIAG